MSPLIQPSPATGFVTHGDDAGQGVKDQPDLLLPVTSALLVLWQQNARSPRLATPLLRTAEVLLLHTPLLELGSPSADVLGELSHGAPPA